MMQLQRSEPVVQVVAVHAFCRHPLFIVIL